MKYTEMAKAMLISDGWTESRAYHAIRIASNISGASMEAVAEEFVRTGRLSQDAVRLSEEVVVQRSKLEALRRMVRGRAATILDSMLR